MAESTHRHGAGERAGMESTSTRRLMWVALVNLAGFVVELAGGLIFGSIALVSDAFHMLFDMLAYAIAFGASYTAERFRGGARWSYGLHRLEPIAAFLNGALLLPMVGYIVWESYQRFLEPVAIDPGLTLVIAVGGLAVNLGAVYVLQGGRMSLNERGAFYHLLGDAGGSIAVIVSTLAIALGGFTAADPIAAVVIGALILWSAGRVLRESIGILLESSPVAIDDVEDDLVDVDGVERIDDVHVWQVCSQLTVATVRLVDRARTLEERRAIRERIHARLREHGIDHATVELRRGREAAGEPADRVRHEH